MKREWLLRSLVLSAALLLLVLLLAVPVAAAPAQSPAQVGAGQAGALAYVATGALNVRAGPGIQHGVVDIVYWGQPVTLMSRNSAGTWVNVRTPSGKNGWVNASYLNATVAIGTLPVAGAAPSPTGVVNVGAVHVRSGPGMNYSSIAIAYQGNQVQLLGRNAGWIKVRTPGGVVGWIGSNLLNLNVSYYSLPHVAVAPTGTTGTTGAVNVGAANVRSGPGMNYGVRTYVYQGTSVTLLGRTASAGWLFIRTPSGVEGWIGATLINTTVSLYSLPVVGASQPSASGTVNVGALHVRSGPSVGYNPIAIIYGGDTVTLLGRNAQASWVQVRLADGRVGWVNASYLNTVTSIINLPVAWW